MIRGSPSTSRVIRPKARMLSFVRALATLRSKRLSCLADACEPHSPTTSSTSRRAYQRSSARIWAKSRIASRYDLATARLTRIRCFRLKPRSRPGDLEARHQTLDVPFERPGQRLVEVVDAEDQPPVGSRERAEVRQMRVAAELNLEARARRIREVRRHQGSSTAVERERRDEHAPVADRNQLRDARLRLLLEHLDRITPARRRLPLRVRRARDLCARRLPPRRALRPREVLARRVRDRCVWRSWPCSHGRFNLRPHPPASPG